MKVWIVIASALVSLAATAQTNGVLWTGDFETGAASLSGNCSYGQNQWCQEEMIKPQQLQLVQSPVAQGKYALRVQVDFGDYYGGYSDSRSLITGPDTLWETEGTEKWYRLQVLFPDGYVGAYPKWDELSSWPTSYSTAGWFLVWHHDANGGVETGSAPVYFGTDADNLRLCLVNQATSECRENLSLGPIKRGQWRDIVVHALWSTNPSAGFLEIWIDGVNVLPKHYASNMYPGMRNYLVAGLYRNERIGDPTLLWPNGTPVYGNDGTPGVIYMDGFIDGTSQQAVMSETLVGAPPAGGGADAGTGGGGTGGSPDAGGAPADAGGGPAVPPADGGAVGGTPSPDAGAPPVQTDPPKSGFGGMGYSGCATGGTQLAWMVLPLLALAFLRRRRSPAK